MKTFVEFLIESELAKAAASKGMGGWFHIDGKRLDSYNNELHAETIRLYPRDFGIDREAAKEVGDGHYGQFYSYGWVRWLVEYDNVENLSFIKCTSSISTLQSPKAKKMMEELVRELQPELLWINNAWDNYRDTKQYWTPDFEKRVEGEQLQKVISGGKLEY